MNRAECQKPDACRAKSEKHCRGCTLSILRRDPAIEAKRAAAYRAKMTDPVFRAQHAARSQANLARWRDTPEGAARVREVGMANLAHTKTPEAAKARGAAIREAALSWCPPEYRDAYLALRAKGIPAPEARRIMEPDIPGTLANAKREIANAALRQRLRAARERQEAY